MSKIFLPILLLTQTISLLLMKNEKLSWPVCERKDCFEPWNTDTNTAQKKRFSINCGFGHIY